MKEYADYYIKRLKGPDSDDAYYSLIEADDGIIPILIERFRSEKDSAIRSELVEIIWQHRNLDTVEFLSEALEDTAPQVWKNALDGLVALAGPKAMQVLRSAQNRVFPKQRQTDEFQAWLKEAIEQAEEMITRKREGEWH